MHGKKRSPVELRVILSGSSGFIGRALFSFLCKKGIQVRQLVRRAARNSSELFWDPQRGILPSNVFENVDAVVHLGGDSIFSFRWSSRKKERIWQSRVQTTQMLSEALCRCSCAPPLFLSASAVGYYGSRGEEILTEASCAGSGFLPEVCKDWECASSKAPQAIQIRFGIVLDPNGGILSKMIPAFLCGLGTVLGSGKQWMSWIALEDLLSAILFAIENRPFTGPVNLTSPFPVLQEEFAQKLAHSLSRPLFLKIPSVALRLLFGQMADELLLSSIRASPTRLLSSGFSFQFSTLSETFSHYFERKQK